MEKLRGLYYTLNRYYDGKYYLVSGCDYELISQIIKGFYLWDSHIKEKINDHNIK